MKPLMRPSQSIVAFAALVYAVFSLSAAHVLADTGLGNLGPNLTTTGTPTPPAPDASTTVSAPPQANSVPRCAIDWWKGNQQQEPCLEPTDPRAIEAQPLAAQELREEWQSQSPTLSDCQWVDTNMGVGKEQLAAECRTAHWNSNPPASSTDCSKLIMTHGADTRDQCKNFVDTQQSERDWACTQNPSSVECRGCSSDPLDPNYCGNQIHDERAPEPQPEQANSLQDAKRRFSDVTDEDIKEGWTRSIEQIEQEASENVALINQHADYEKRQAEEEIVAIQDQRNQLEAELDRLRQNQQSRQTAASQQQDLEQELDQLRMAQQQREERQAQIEQQRQVAIQRERTRAHQRANKTSDDAETARQVIGIFGAILGGAVAVKNAKRRRRTTPTYTPAPRRAPQPGYNSGGSRPLPSNPCLSRGGSGSGTECR